MLLDYNFDKTIWHDKFPKHKWYNMFDTFWYLLPICLCDREQKKPTLWIETKVRINANTIARNNNLTIDNSIVNVSVVIVVAL